MRYWVGVSSALGIGGILGFLAGGIILDKRLNEQYEENLEIMKGAYERALNLRSEKPAASEEELDISIAEEDGTMMLPHDSWKGKIGYTPSEVNPYHVPVETTSESFVNGSVNQYGISYIEDEDYMDDDGRSKTQVTMTIDNMEPYFFIEGELIEDWADKLGASIAEDFLTHTHAAPTRVLYVRNHRTDEDYEVILESP